MARRPVYQLVKRQTYRGVALDQYTKHGKPVWRNWYMEFETEKAGQAHIDERIAKGHLPFVPKP